MALNYVTIHETFNDGQGQPYTGSAVFTPSQDVFIAGETILSAKQPLTMAIVNGQFASPVTLLATDNAGLKFPTMTGFFYWTVQVTLAGDAKPAWSFSLPSNPATVDLYDLANTGVGSGGSGGAVDSVNGQTGVVVLTASDVGADTSGAAAAAQTDAEAASLPRSGGVMTGKLAPAVVTLTDAATIAVDASQGNDFRVTLTGNRTMGAPSNPADGQMIMFELTQDAVGSRIVTWDAVYNFGANGAPALSTAPNIIDQVGFKYNAGQGKWLCTGSALGF